MNEKYISCNNCLHDGVCYMQEICGGEIEEQLREFGCEDFKHRKYWTESDMAFGDGTVAVGSVPFVVI